MVLWSISVHVKGLQSEEVFPSGSRFLPRKTLLLYFRNICVSLFNHFLYMCMYLL